MRAATRVQPAIRAFHCNRVISLSLQSGWSRLGWLGRSLKGSREPRHPKENEENENLKKIMKIYPQLFLLKDVSHDVGPAVVTRQPTVGPRLSSEFP